MITLVQILCLFLCLCAQTSALDWQRFRQCFENKCSFSESVPSLFNLDQTPLQQSEYTVRQGKKFRRVDEVEIQVVEPRGLIDDDSAGGNSTQLSDWEPINDQIGQNQTKYYQFNVNTTATGLSSYYHVLVFLSGNICSMPSDSNGTLKVDYGYDINLVTNITNATYDSEEFVEGYFKGLSKYTIMNDSNDTFVTLYTKVTSPSTGNFTDIWNYQIGISQEDLVYQWDNRTWITAVDTDDDSALLITGNFTQASSLKTPNSANGTSEYEVYIYEFESDKTFFKGLQNSWCAVRNGPAVLSSINDMNISFTSRSNSLRQQFFVSGLNKSTQYVGYALKSNTEASYGGTVFKPIRFNTKETSACSLIYDLAFCDDVAYSVPTPMNENITREQIRSLYDSNAELLFQNFTKALNQVNCETEKDAIYSPLRTCDDCRSSYKNWLCSITIPRCTTDPQDEYVFREAQASRNSFTPSTIDGNITFESGDYYEILPCYNTCHSIVRDCPAVFGFSCPKNVSINPNSSYYWDAGLDHLTCNYVGVTSSNMAAGLVRNFALIAVCFFLIMLG